MTAPTSRQQDAALAPTSRRADVHLYDFLRYVDKQRMVTFWYQMAEVMQLGVDRVLEVGVGPGIVTSMLRGMHKETKTADINPELRPDYLVPVQRLSSVVPVDSFDLILCARVLHYVPPAELDQTLAELHKVTRRHLIVTLPVDELRISFGCYVSTRPWHWTSLRFPLALKRALLRLLPERPDPPFGRTWKLDCCAEMSRANFEARLSRLFTVERSYPIPEKTTHHLFVLSKRDAPQSGGASHAATKRPTAGVQN